MTGRLVTPGRRSVRARPRGQVIVVFALTLVVLFAAAGLAFDIGRFYSEKRFLQNAADAAALAAANALIRGDSNADAEAQARAVLLRNYQTPPNGVVPALPASPPEYASGHAGDPSYLADGILVSGGEVRVAVKNVVGYTFGRVVGLTSNVVGGRARVKLQGNLLPIAVRRYVNAPGTNSGVEPCNGNENQFMDFFATANTACLGTETDAARRTAPEDYAGFDSLNPASDPIHHGPIVTILGQGAQPDNASDFRGFIALDVRNFADANSQLYYSGVNSNTNSNTLKAMEAAWISNGGYTGPMFPAATTPPDFNDQVAVMSGNSTGQAIDAMLGRFAPGDTIMVAVYPGQTMAIPDFTVTTPGTLLLPNTGTVANPGSFKVSKNKEFSSQVALSTTADAGDPANPMVLGTLGGGATPITYTPNPVTPTQGSGTSVAMTNVTTAGAATGVYTLWIRGEAGSPYLTVKHEQFPVIVGSVSRDFTITASSSEETAANAGDSVSFGLNLKRVGGAFGSNVTLSVDPTAPWGDLPTGLGAITFSSSSVSPTSGNGTNVTLTINSGTTAPGNYKFVVRATGTNSDGQPVTHLLPLRVNVGTGSGGNKSYVDIVGFAVMRIVDLDANRVNAYAITPVIVDPEDDRLRRGQVARLVPWS